MAIHDRAETNRTGFEVFYNKPLNKQEVFEIEQNLLGLFNLLYEIDRRKRSDGTKRQNTEGKESQC